MTTLDVRASHATGTAEGILRPTRITVPDGGALRRPPRPPEQREPGYLDAYDATTVWYDVFSCDTRVLAVGPPIGTARPFLDALRVRDGRGRARAFRSEGGLDRLGRFWARAGDGPLTVEGPGLARPVPVGEDLAARFAGRRAIMTLQKDNDLEWIAAWARWYRVHHGADAVIVYDNASTRYSREELRDALRAAVPEADVLVVAWDVPYGPIGRFPHFHFDSNYAQNGALEHARWRLLRRASLLAVDIDELVVGPVGASVFDRARRAPSGALTLEGRWMYPDPQTPPHRRPRHEDSYWMKVRPPDAPSPTKWCVAVPQLPRIAQLGVHRIDAVPDTRDPDFWFGHLLSISTNWAGGRAGAVADPQTHVIEPTLRARLAQHEPAAPAPAPQHPRRALREWARRGAWVLRRARRRVRRGLAR